MAERERSILDQIEQDARIMRRARMLPTDRPLTKEELDQVARDVRKWLKESGRSAQSVSRALGKGFSPATISNFLNGMERGDHEKTARALNEYMERETRAGEAKRPQGFVETSVAKRMLVVVRTAVETKSIGLVVGPAGMGKTLTAKAAASIYTGSIYLRVTQSERRNTGLIASLARMLGVPARGTISITHRLVIEHLSGTGRPLLIDEAHALQASAIDALRDIHDEAEVPIVLWGTHDVRRKVNDTEAWYGQLNSRIVATCDLGELANPPRGGGAPLFTVEEIQRLFTSDKLKLTGDGAAFLHELACIPGLGGLRICAKIMDVAMRMPKIRAAGRVGADQIRAICKQMHGQAYVELANLRRNEFSTPARKVVGA
jgi:DNA transposition AAA+ family ATPase